MSPLLKSAVGKKVLLTAASAGVYTNERKAPPAAGEDAAGKGTGARLSSPSSQCPTPGAQVVARAADKRLSFTTVRRLPPNGKSAPPAAGGPLSRGCRHVFWPVLLLITVGLLALPASAQAQPLPGISLQVNPTNNPAQVVDSVKILVLLTILALAPAFLVMVTSFTRIVVVLSILRSAIGIQQTPPNQVIIGLALFLTAFVMTPVFTQINNQAVQPYLNNQLTQQQAWDAAAKPLKTFMLKQTREKDLALFIKLSHSPQPRNANDVSLTAAVPAFVISELKTAFEMGFLLYVPFLVIDMVVATALMSMGMFMLPPVMISLPFKLLLFVMVDGWYLVVKSLVESFH